MGANTFKTVSTGNTAKEAFFKATEEAAYDSGHGGYTGTIAEKSGFTEIPLPEGEDPFRFAHRLIHDGDRRIDDKWGPAGCVKLATGKWLFFGWASS
jgi:hypothetical protein